MRASASPRTMARANRRDAGRAGAVPLAACDVPDCGAIKREFGPGLGRGPVQFEVAQMTMDVAARADALHDLLAEVAALVEVQGPLCEVSCGRSRSSMSMP